MGYKDKKIKERLFKKALTDLTVFAFARPVLPLSNRRAIVEAINLGGSLANRYKQTQIKKSTNINYQYTAQGLIRACQDKMINHPETVGNARHAIHIIYSLSAWAKTNPNRAQDMFDDFAFEMVPEDVEQNPSLPIVDVIGRNFRKEVGQEKALDLVVCSPNVFYRKYKTR